MAAELDGVDEYKVVELEELGALEVVVIVDVWVDVLEVVKVVEVVEVRVDAVELVTVVVV